MFSDLLKDNVPNLKHSSMQDKYLTHKQKQQSEQKVSVHKSLDEELESLTFMNKSAGSLNGVRGVEIKQGQMGNLFSWGSLQVYNIFEADSDGKIIDSQQSPILYVVFKSPSGNQFGRSRLCCSSGVCEIAVTTKLDGTSSDPPYLYLKESSSCCGISSCSIEINKNGNSVNLGTIQRGCCLESYSVTSKYLNNLQITTPFLQKLACGGEKYQVTDGNRKKGVLTTSLSCCRSNDSILNVGFPPTYGTDQKTILLATALYLGTKNLFTQG